MKDVTVMPYEQDENFNSMKRTTDELPAEPSSKRIKIESERLHDEFAWSQPSQSSQASEDSICDIDKRESLNKFLSLYQISPVKEMKKPFSMSSDRTQRRYTKKAKQALDSMLTIIAPNESDVLYNTMLRHVEEKGEQIMKEIYLQAQSWQFRRQVLSILVQQKSFEDCQKIIPSITTWRYYEAKKHGKTVGVGVPVSETTAKRVKIDNSSLEHFVDFITSSHIIKDLPFGQKTLKLESGEIVKIPNIVRSLSASTIVEQYQQICEIDNISPIGKSTCFQILTECSASVRKCLEGLDNYVTEGSRAFQILEEHLDEISNKDLKRKLLDLKHYLKTDFKVHLSNDTSIQDHCMAYSLSAQNRDYRHECDHNHNLRCVSCMALDETLRIVLEVTNTTELDHKDAVLFKIEKAIYDIKELQKHLVRSKNQELARSKIIQEMTESVVILTCDWAMKFLPRRYREGMVDWFAKRGINWHISVATMKSGELYHTATYIHIFKSQMSQDAATTTAVICDTIADIQRRQPSIKEFHLFSDNAGCYKSTLTLTTLKSHLGEALISYNFSEAQNGKGPCDRKAAHAKAGIKKYVNEGHDVTTAEDMKVMSQCCLAYKSSCSGEFLALEALEDEEKLTLYGELHLLPSSLTKCFQVCSAHRQEVQADVKKRCRRKECEISYILGSLSFHKNKRAGDRHVTGTVCKKVAEVTGLFIPVGTPICRLCRQKLLATEAPAKEETTEICETMKDVTVMPYEQDENFNSMKRTTDELPAEPSSKRIKIESERLHDEFAWSQPSQSSQASEDSICDIDKRESLNKFLSLFQISPVKEMKKPFSMSSDRTQRRYTKKAKQALDSMLTIIAPNESDVLYNTMLRHVEEKGEQIMKEIYLQAQSWQFRRQVLSILVQQKSFEDCQKIIPSITTWRYYEAKKHGKTVGVGVPVSETTAKRVKIDNSSLEHFVDFITSSHIIKDLPFGQKTLKLESGEIVKIPNIVRSLSASTIVEQYQQICEIDNISPIGKSTCFQILTECSASVRKCLEGLDNYVTEGSLAFQILEEHLDEISNKDLKRKLLDLKHYLKTDFKVHLSNDTSIQDHCMAYSLSAQNRDYRHECDHNHNLRCVSCMALDETLRIVLEVTNTTELDHKDAVLFKIEKAIYDIKELQKHLVRSKNQELARSKIIQEMTESVVILTCDWAMKFLPRRYREGMVDWFAKRGINWHISVATMKSGELYHTATYIHIFKSQMSQDAATTTAVIRDTIADIQRRQPSIKEFHLFSDNAGCYKSTLTLTTLKSHLGEALISYNFSEAQNGKGPCDRKAAHAKAGIKKYVNEGHDVTTAEDMKVALDKIPTSSYRVRVVDTIQELDADEEEKHPIKKLTTFYNFKYENEGLRMWQAYDVGKGKLEPWSELSPHKNAVSLKVVSDWKDESVERVAAGKSLQKNYQRKEYFCQKDGCVKEFKDKESLEQHMLLDKCDYQLERRSDKVKIMYSKKLEQNVPRCSTSAQTGVVTNERHIDMGWALKIKKKKTQFTKAQKDFMITKFNIGKLGGHKVDPYAAAEEMRLSDQFTKDQFLTAQQIGSFFSRYAQQQKKNTDEEDLIAATEEDRKMSIKREIMAYLEA